MRQQSEQHEQQKSDSSKEKVVNAHGNICPAVQISQKTASAGLESRSPLLLSPLQGRSQIRLLCKPATTVLLFDF